MEVPGTSVGLLRNCGIAMWFYSILNDKLYLLDQHTECYYSCTAVRTW